MIHYLNDNFYYRFVNKHIDSTMNDANFNSKDGDSVLQKLLKIDRHAALVMVSDTLFAGVDTVSYRSFLNVK